MLGKFIRRDLRNSQAGLGPHVRRADICFRLRRHRKCDPEDGDVFHAQNFDANAVKIGKNAKMKLSIWITAAAMLSACSVGEGTATAQPIDEARGDNSGTGPRREKQGSIGLAVSMHLASASIKRPRSELSKAACGRMLVGETPFQSGPLFDHLNVHCDDESGERCVSIPHLVARIEGASVVGRLGSECTEALSGDVDLQGISTSRSMVRQVGFAPVDWRFRNNAAAELIH